MKNRRAFTLVELLVSMALIIFIMAIISQAFVAATGVFHELKSAGDMAEKLRATTQILQRDLAADHFDGKKHLSTPDFWSKGPPRQGYFRIWQGSAGVPEGPDLDGIVSYRSVDHMLAFTIHLTGNQMSDFLSASGPMANNPFFGPGEARYQTGTTYNYQWGEVVWFLQPSINPVTGLQDMTAEDTTTGAQPLPLYTLYRAQKLAVPDNSLVPTQPIANLNQFLEISCWQNTNTNPANLYFNSPEDLTVPWRRFGMVPYISSINNQAALAGLLYATPSPLYPGSLWPQLPPWLPPNPYPPVAMPTYYPYLLPPPPLPYQPPLTPYYPTLTQQMPLGTASNLLGADIQLTDVISFDVRMYITDTTGQPANIPGSVDPFVTLLSYIPQINPPANNNVLAAYMNSTAPYNLNPAFFAPNPAPTPGGPTLIGPAVFDTWTSNNDGLNDPAFTKTSTLSSQNYTQWNNPAINPNPNPTTFIPLWNSITQSGPIIKAIQVSIRIWDPKTNRSRQVTIVQAM